MSELFKRVLDPTPKFWKRIRNICIGLGTMGIMMYYAPDGMIPEMVATYSGYFITAGIIGAGLSQMTKSNPQFNFNPLAMPQKQQKRTSFGSDDEDPLL